MVYLTIAIKKVRLQLFKSCHIYHLSAKSISNFQVQGTLPASVEGLITPVLIISTLRAVCPKELDKLKLVSLTNKQISTLSQKLMLEMRVSHTTKLILLIHSTLRTLITSAHINQLVPATTAFLEVQQPEDLIRMVRTMRKTLKSSLITFMDSNQSNSITSKVQLER